ncbi:MAG: hypothetical protein AMXMBFR7_48950 [Planctomycetota bacterium]
MNLAHRLPSSAHMRLNLTCVIIPFTELYVFHSAGIKVGRTTHMRMGTRESITQHALLFMTVSPSSAYAPWAESKVYT